MFPGKPLTNMIFKAYSTQTMAVAINFTQDLKLGHYIKVPPRATFIGTLCIRFDCASMELMSRPNSPIDCYLHHGSRAGWRPRVVV